MTKNSILVIPLLLLCLNIFAQETKPWLFIGYYETAKGMCGDRVYVREEIKDLAEYKLRSQQFNAEHIGFNPTSEFVTEKQCVIISEFTTNRSVFKCFPKGNKAFKAYTIEDCRKLMEQDRILFEKNRSVQPNIIFTWCGGNAEGSGSSSGGGNKIACEKLPQVLISETGVYYWKTDDGSYVILTKEQYEKTKKLPGDTERKKYIQDCSGQNTRIEIPSHNQGYH
jgi:hypothetical protein